MALEPRVVVQQQWKFGEHNGTIGFAVEADEMGYDLWKRLADLVSEFEAFVLDNPPPADTPPGAP